MELGSSRVEESWTDDDIGGNSGSGEVVMNGEEAEEAEQQQHL